MRLLSACENLIESRGNEASKAKIRDDRRAVKKAVKKERGETIRLREADQVCARVGPSVMQKKIVSGFVVFGLGFGLFLIITR